MSSLHILKLCFDSSTLSYKRPCADKIVPKSLVELALQASHENNLQANIVYSTSISIASLSASSSSDFSETTWFKSDVEISGSSVNALTWVILQNVHNVSWTEVEKSTKHVGGFAHKDFRTYHCKQEQWRILKSRKHVGGFAHKDFRTYHCRQEQWRILKSSKHVGGFAHKDISLQTRAMTYLKIQ